MHLRIHFKRQRMKKVFFIITAGIAIMAAACQKSLEVDRPTFSVSLNRAQLVADTFTYKLGDTTRFLFAGKADNIAFYSGETGKKYDNRKVSWKLGNVVLSFSSKAEFGAQTNTLQVFAINKLTASDSAAVVNAAWTNITSKVKLATSATVVASGEVNLTELMANEKDSLFIAFKYTGVTGSTQRTWTISNFFVNNIVDGTAYNGASLATDASYWTRYGNVWEPASGRWAASAAELKITGGNASAASNTSWIISKPIYAGRLAPDVSVGIKSINEPAKAEYGYKYTAPGVYKATFVAFNTTPDAEKSTVHELIVKVIP